MIKTQIRSKGKVNPNFDIEQSHIDQISRINRKDMVGSIINDRYVIEDRIVKEGMSNLVFNIHDKWSDNLAHDKCEKHAPLIIKFNKDGKQHFHELNVLS